MIMIMIMYLTLNDLEDVFLCNPIAEEGEKFHFYLIFHICHYVSLTRVEGTIKDNKIDWLL